MSSLRQQRAAGRLAQQEVKQLEVEQQQRAMQHMAEQQRKQQRVEQQIIDLHKVERRRQQREEQKHILNMSLDLQRVERMSRRRQQSEEQKQVFNMSLNLQRVERMGRRRRPQNEEEKHVLNMPLDLQKVEPMGQGRLQQNEEQKLVLSNIQCPMNMSWVQQRTQVRPNAKTRTQSQQSSFHHINHLLSLPPDGSESRQQVPATSQQLRHVAAPNEPAETRTVVQGGMDFASPPTESALAQNVEAALNVGLDTQDVGEVEIVFEGGTVECIDVTDDSCEDESEDDDELATEKHEPCKSDREKVPFKMPFKKRKRMQIMQYPKSRFISVESNLIFDLTVEEEFRIHSINFRRLTEYENFVKVMKQARTKDLCFEDYKKTIFATAFTLDKVVQDLGLSWRYCKAAIVNHAECMRIYEEVVLPSN